MICDTCSDDFQFEKHCENKKQYISSERYIKRLFLHSYQAGEIWSANYLRIQVTMEVNMSALSENFSYVSGNNPAKFHAFYKKCKISLFFAPYLPTRRSRRVDMFLIFCSVHFRGYLTTGYKCQSLLMKEFFSSHDNLRKSLKILLHER